MSSQPTEPKDGTIVDFPNSGIPVAFATARDAALEAGEDEPHILGFCPECRREAKTLDDHGIQIIAWAQEIQRQVEVDDGLDTTVISGLACAIENRGIEITSNLPRSLFCDRFPRRMLRSI